jgi:hypothetical protein
MLRAARAVAAVREPVRSQRFACAALATACVATAVFSQQIAGFPHGSTVSAFLFARDGDLPRDLPRANNEESEMSKLRSMVVGSALAIASVASAQNAVEWRVADGGNGHWYQGVGTANGIGWASAQVACVSAGGSLVSIGTAAESSWLYETIAWRVNLWSNSGPFIVGPWIGARGASGNWRWDDGTPWNYSAWFPGEGPPSADPREQFAHFYNGVGPVVPNNSWGDYFDEPFNHSYIIEWSADCNNDGIVDYGQILAGALVDADHNNVPDCCEQGYACDASHELLVNGGLEGGSYAGCASFVTLYAGSTAIPGWAIGPNGIDWIWSTPTDSCCDSSPQGDRYIDLNGSPAMDGGAIRQFIQTQVGHRYRISFLAIPNSYGSLAGTPKAIRVTTGSLASEQTLYTLSDGKVPPCDWNTWTHIQREWIATESVSMIELKSLVLNDAGGVFVDAISVTEVSCTNGDCDSLLVPSQYPTIQAAIDAVPAGAQRTVLVAAGTYHESFALNGKDVIVRGAANNATILDGTGLTTSIARFTGGEPATAGVESLVFRNGIVGSRFTPKSTFTIGGALYGVNSAAAIRNCRFEQNIADFGGGVYLLRCAMNVVDSDFAGNTARDEGGGMQVYETTGVVSGCDFTQNLSGTAGPGSGSGFKAVGAHAAAETVLLTGCTFAGGISGVNGSAVEYYENTANVPGILRMSGCAITGNSSGLGAGGLRVIGGMYSCVLTGGTAICSNTTSNVDGPYLIEGSATVCDCLADFTHDGVLNGADLGVLLSNWGLTLPSGAGDVNHDGIVNGPDLAMLLGSWGPCQ